MYLTGFGPGHTRKGQMSNKYVQSQCKLLPAIKLLSACCKLGLIS